MITSARIICTSALIALLLTFTACIVVPTPSTPEPASSPVEVKPASVQLDPTSGAIQPGKNQAFRAVAKDASGAVIPDLPPSAFTWSSTNEAVATVDKNGLAVGRSAGTVDIIVSVNGVAVRASLTVRAPVASIQIEPATATTQQGKSQAFRAIARDASDTVIADMPAAAFAWSSDNPAVATVDGSGSTEGRSPGTADIFASVDGVAARATLLVRGHIASVELDPPSATIQQGRTSAFGLLPKTLKGSP